MPAIDDLIERSRQFNKGLDLLRKIHTTFEAMKQSDKLPLDAWNEELDAGILKFRFCGVQMYARLEIRNKIQIIREDGPAPFSFVPILVWGSMHRNPEGKHLASDYTENAYHERVLLTQKEKGAFTLRGTEGQVLSSLLAEIILGLITSVGGK